MARSPWPLTSYRLGTADHDPWCVDDTPVSFDEGPKEEPIPPELDLGDFCPIKFSHFDYFCLPQKLAAERREYEMSFRDLPYHYYGNT